MAELLRGIDVYVSPSFEDDNMLFTNLTGHLYVVLPNGLNELVIPRPVLKKDAAGAVQI
jgi:hypothetical protein